MKFLNISAQVCHPLEIAEKMDVKPRTIDTHRVNLIKIFNLKSGHDLRRCRVW
ncbi:MAG: LuxR C-terminal-related transcriptional regulator [Ignavibacteriaceae bacterium]|nr:LuxR C-terminal-related transcriptional regulator [Ignavibacteriaceae bacterium]